MAYSICSRFRSSSRAHGKTPSETPRGPILLQESGLRHYSPGLGRWTKRDPVEEGGGLNVYAFVSNGPLHSWDWLGLRTVIGIDRDGKPIYPPTPYDPPPQDEDPPSDAEPDGPALACVCAVLAIDVGVPDPTDLVPISLWKCCGYAGALAGAALIDYCLEQSDIEPRDVALNFCIGLCTVAVLEPSIGPVDRGPAFQACMHECMESMGFSY